MIALRYALCKHNVVSDISRSSQLIAQSLASGDPRPENFNQAACLRAIRPGTFCNNDSDRQPMRIHTMTFTLASDKS